MSEHITIARRFRGPPDSANGGYTVGLVAEHVGGPSEVTLKAPPPLDTPLVVVRDGQGVRLERDGRAVAEGRETDLDPDLPEPVSLGTAVDASRSYIGFDGRTFMECFVCGPDRGEGDGLRIFAGEVPGRRMVAAPWIPGEDLAGEDGTVKDVYMWAALDCPTYFAGEAAFGPSRSLLGRLTGWIIHRVQPGEPLVVTAWPESQEGRKRFAGSALVSESGAVLALARATWIELRPDS
jgi:hypothetical protein